MQYRFLRSFPLLTGVASRQNKTAWILTSAVSAFILFMIAVSVQAQRVAARELLAQGITVPAVVTSDDVIVGPADARRHAIGVRFTDRDGNQQEQATWQFLGWSERRRLQTGTSVDIVYLPRRTYTPFVKDALVRVAGSGWVAALTATLMLAALATMLRSLFLKVAPDTSAFASDTLPHSLN